MKHKHSIALDDLKAWRKKAGLRQADLAHLLGVHTSRMSQMETGRARPSLDQLLALSFIYGKPLEVLLSGALDKVTDRLVARLRKMPKAPADWRGGYTRSQTLADLARRLATHNNDGRV